MTTIDDWPSLGYELELALALYDSAEPVSVWLSEELARTDDNEFARTFSDHIDLPGVAHRDYLHRVIRTARGNLLGGIRFHGRNINRPFVEIIAHSFDDLGALTDCVALEWSAFAPKALRVRAAPAELDDERTVLDQTVHIARCHAMPAPADSVRLAPFADVADALELVRVRYRGLDPRLARNLAAASLDDLRRWHAADQLHAIESDGVVAGALAVVPARIRWIDGAEIHEEVVAVEYAGNHLATQAQCRWAAQCADRDQLLIGTIDGLNAASRRTAEAAGRPRMLDLVFVELSRST